MKPITVSLFLTLLVATGQCPIKAAAGPSDCGRIEVRAQVEVPAGEVTLADILATGTCSAAVRSAARIRLGAAPLPGSPRVLRGDEVLALVERLENREEDFEVLSANIPERVTIRRAKSGNFCSDGAAHLAVLSSDDRTVKNSQTCATRLSLHTARSGNPSPKANLVRRGERVRLEWDASGIRITVPAVALDAGAFGEQVRARIEPSGRMMPAIVVDRGQLRAGS